MSGDGTLMGAGGLQTRAVPLSLGCRVCMNIMSRRSGDSGEFFCEEGGAGGGCCSGDMNECGRVALSCEERSGTDGDRTEEERGRSPIGNSVLGGRGPVNDRRGEDSEELRDIETRILTPVFWARL